MTIVLQRLSLILAILLAAAAARAADTSPQVWLLSTREAAHCGQLDDPAQAVRYWRLNDDCDWSPAEAKDFHAGDDLAAPTVVFVPAIAPTPTTRWRRDGTSIRRSVRKPTASRFAT